MATRMQQRRGTAQQWTDANPILNIGEIGYESDNNKFKIGDGVNHWADLAYFLDEETLGTSLDGYIPDSLLGVANGVAQLNSSGKLVSDQIPNIDEITQDLVDGTIVAGTGLDKTYDDNAGTITLDIDSTVATKTYADGKASDAQAAAELTASGALSTHSSDTTSVHGITDTAELATKAFAAELLTNATKTNVTITGDKNGLTITAENGVADSTTSDLTEGTNLYFTDERAQDAVGNAVGTGLTYTDSTGAISVTPNTYDAYGSAAAITASTLGLGNVDNTSDADKPVSTATQTALDAKLALAGGTMTGAITLPTDPSSALHAATKQYVDNTASGIVAKPQVLAATSTNLATTYSNGTAGVGATLTHTSNGAWPETVAGATGWVVGSGFLVKNQTNKAENGRYYLSDLGSASTPWVLTRCGYCDEADEIPGAYIFVQGGTLAGTGWIQVVSDPATFVVGTDNIDVYQFSGSGTITAGTNISVSGNQVSTVADPTFTSLTVGDVSNTEFGYLNGVTSAIQTQLDAKQAVVSGVSDTEIGYLDGVTSGIQGQIDDKAPKASPVFTSSLTLNSGQIDSFTVDSSGNVVAGGSVTGTNVNASSGFATNNGQETVFTTDTSGNLTANGTITAKSGFALNNGQQAVFDVNTSGVVTAASFVGNGSGLTGISSYSAPTLGSTSIASGATVTTIAGLTLTAPVINLATKTRGEDFSSYTLILSDNGKIVEMQAVDNATLTVPANSSVAFPIGAQVHILRVGTPTLTVVGASGVTVNATPGLKLRAQWSSATLIKRATDTWVLIGDLSA